MPSIRRAALALALSCLAAPQVDAAPFTLVIHETESQLALRTDRGPAGAAYWAAYAATGHVEVRAHLPGPCM
jgi:hypothetical protein